MTEQNLEQNSRPEAKTAASDNPNLEVTEINYGKPTRKIVSVLFAVTVFIILLVAIYALMIGIDVRNYSQAKKQLDADLAAYQEYISQVPALRQEAQTLSLNITKNKAELEAVTKAYDEKKQEFDEANAALARYNDLKNEINELEASKIKVTNDISDLTADKTALEKNINALSAEEKELKTSRNTLTDEVNKLKSSADALELKIKDGEAYFADLQKEGSSLKVLQGELADMQKSIAAAIDGFTDLKGKLDQQFDAADPSSLPNAAKRTDELLTKLEASSTKFDAQLADQDQELKAFKNNLAGTKDNYEKLIGEQQRQFNEYAAAQQQKMDEFIEAQQQKLTEFNTVMTDAAAKISAAADSSGQISQDLSTILTALKQLSTNAQASQSELGTVLGNLKSSSDLQEVISSLKAVLADVQTNADKLTSSLQIIDEAKERINNAVNAELGGIEKVQELSNAYQQMLDELKQIEVTDKAAAAQAAAEQGD